MKQKRSLVFTSIIFMLSIGNYFRIKGNENIRPIQFVSIFVIGLLAGLLIREIIALTSRRKNEQT